MAGAPGHRRTALPGRPVAVSLLAIAIRAFSLFVIIKVAGSGAMQRPFDDLRPAWLGVAALAELVTFLAYVIAYRSLVGRDGLSWSTVVRIVVSGFGPLSVSGGFGVDKRAWRVLAPGNASAHPGVGAMATLEWAVLAPITAVVAIVLLVEGSPLAGSLLWPWALGIPAAVVAAWWATAPGRRDRLRRPFGRNVPLLPSLLDGLGAVREMVAHPYQNAGAWIGTLGYWVAEICCFSASLRVVGLDLGIGQATLAYATGYLASRRSLPLGGAGVAEALLVYSLYELHQPLGPAVAAVLIYRVFNFLIVVIPALIAYVGLTSVLAEAEERATLAE